MQGHRELKIEQKPSMLKLVEGSKFGGSSFNGDGAIQQSVRTDLDSRKKERTSNARSNKKRIPLIWDT